MLLVVADLFGSGSGATHARSPDISHEADIFCVPPFAIASWRITRGKSVMLFNVTKSMAQMSDI